MPPQMKGWTSTEARRLLHLHGLSHQQNLFKGRKAKNLWPPRQRQTGTMQINTEPIIPHFVQPQGSQPEETTFNLQGKDKGEIMG